MAEIKVVDASALAAVVFGEPAAEQIAQQVADTRIAAPALLWFELASVCLKKLRNHPEQREEILTAHSMAGELEIDVLEITLDEVVRLAEVEDLTVYDASYLWLARALHAELVTRDTRLDRAWRAGISDLA